MEHTEVRSGESTLSRTSKDPTPGNVINGQGASLFVTPEPEIRAEDAGIEPDISSGRSEKRPRPNSGEYPASKRRRPRDDGTSGQRNPGQTNRGPVEIITLNDDEPLVPAPAQTSGPAVIDLEVEDDRPAGFVQTPNIRRRPATIRDPVRFHVAELKITKDRGQVFDFVRSNLDRVAKRRRAVAKNSTVQLRLQQMSRIVTNKETEKAEFFLNEKEWKAKIRETIREKKVEYDEAMRLQQEHQKLFGKDPDFVEYPPTFVNAMKARLDAAERDLEIVEDLMRVLRKI